MNWTFSYKKIFWCTLISSIGFLLTYTLLLTHVFAQETAADEVATTSGTSTPTEQLDEIAQQQIESDEQITEQRSILATIDNTQEAVLTERQQARLRNLAANMSNRTEEATKRLELISDRLERRLFLQEAAGYDIRSAQVGLSTARTSLQNSKAALATIDDDVERFLTSNQPRSAWPSVAALYRIAHQSLADAQISIRIAVNELQASSIITEDSE